MSGNAPATPNRVVVFIGGTAGEHLLPSSSDAELIRAGDLVIAADSGLDRALSILVTVHHVVGDLDSVSPEALELARGSGATIHTHQPDKDATDLELALELATGLLSSTADRPGSIHVVGGGGDRLDHLLGVVLLLGSPSLADHQVTASLGRARIAVVSPRSPQLIPAPPGDLVSLIPVHGAVSGITTTGLRWPLLDARLTPGTTRGLSNEVQVEPASVKVTSGTLAVVCPGLAAPVVAMRSGPYDPSPI